MAEIQNQRPVMRQRILLPIIALLLISVISAIAVLAFMNRLTTIRSLTQQQQELVNFAVTNVELGVSTGRFDAVQNFLNDLASNPLFAGVILYDPDGDAILQVPEQFEVPQTVAQRVLGGGAETVGQLAFQSEAITDEDGETIGYLLLAMSFESMNREAQRALLLTALIGLIILLPITAVIAWLLTWMEKRLRAREARLAEVNREIEIMLNNLDQGVFTFNLDGSVNPQHSSRAQELFGVTDFENSTLQQIFGAADATIGVFRQWITMISKSRFLSDWQKYEKLNPFKEITIDRTGKEQVLNVNFRPIVEGDELQRIMVLGNDITAQREAQEALARATRERDAAVGRILAFVQNDRSEVDAVLQETERYLGRADEIGSLEDLVGDDGGLARHLHTLKGNAGSFGFTELGNIAEDMEDVIKAARARKRSARFDDWRHLCAELRTEYEKITEFRAKLFSAGKDRMSITRSEYDDLLADVRSGKLRDPETIHQRLHLLDALPFGVYCEKYQRIIELYRQNNRVRIADLDVRTPDQPIHSTLRAVFEGCVVHLIRNALAHGIESDREREAGNKGPGVVSIALEIADGTASVTISDNGRGIDPDLVSDRAIARNLVTESEVRSMSEQDRRDLVFHHGFSTKSDATEISGRGVGLDAVKTYIERLNGRVSLESHLGLGLAVTVTLPYTPGGIAGDN